jgi:hypothetical protein
MACTAETSIICCLQDKAHTLASRMQVGAACDDALKELQLHFIYAAVLSDCEHAKLLTAAQIEQLEYKLKRYCR